MFPPRKLPSSRGSCNRVRNSSKALEAARKKGFDQASLVPEDPIVVEWDAEAKPLSELGPEAPSMKAVQEIVGNLFF